MGRDGTPLEKLFFFLRAAANVDLSSEPSTGGGPAPGEEHARCRGSCCHARDSHAYRNRVVLVVFFSPLDLFSWSKIGSVQFERLAPSPELQGEAEQGASPP